MPSQRNPLNSLTNPQDPVSSIPFASRRDRDRTWDRTHPVISYSIPPALHEKAKDIRAAILALAQKHMTTISCVSAALTSYALAQVRQGKLSFEPHPNPNRRKISLTWMEVNEDPQEIKMPQKHMALKRFYLGYRWTRDMDTQIKGLAGNVVSPGEVVVFLLSYALDAHKNGRVKLVEESMVVTQKVAASW